MFPSNNNNVPLSYSNETLFRRSSCSYFANGDVNPNISTQLETLPPPLFSNFPSPFLDDHDFFLSHMMMPPQQEQESMQPAITMNNNTHSYDGGGGGLSKITEPTEKFSTSTASDKIAAPKKRRTGKTDRHSKICTAHGIRDRRMRLSLQMARKFFDLQDTLGFDKASKTVEWLFCKSKKAIKGLTQMNNNTSSVEIDHSSLASDCEVVELGTAEISNDKEESQKSTRSQKAARNSTPKHSRDKARARARQRTREKMMIKSLGKPNPKIPDDPLIEYLTNLKVLDYLLGYSSVQNFNEPGEEEYSSSRNQEKVNNSLHEAASSSHSLLNHQLANVEIIENFVRISSSSPASYSIFDYPKNSLVSGDLGVFGDCYISNNMVPSTGNNIFHEQNPSSIFAATSDILFPSQNQEN